MTRFFVEYVQSSRTTLRRYDSNTDGDHIHINSVTHTLWIGGPLQLEVNWWIGYHE